MIETYYYFFYVLHKLFERMNPQGMAANKFRAVMAIIILELWLLFALISLWEVFFNERMSLSFTSPQLLIPFLLITVVNSGLFFFGNKWKIYENKFNEWPIEKNDQGLRVIIGLSIFIFVLFAVSVFLFSEKFPIIRH